MNRRKAADRFRILAEDSIRSSITDSYHIFLSCALRTCSRPGYLGEPLPLPTKRSTNNYIYQLLIKMQLQSSRGSGPLTPMNSGAGISETERLVIQDISYCTSGIFILEMLLKIWGLSVGGYFGSGQNVFDAIIVMLTIVELFLSSSKLKVTQAAMNFITFQYLRWCTGLHIDRYLSEFLVCSLAASASNILRCPPSV